MEIAKRINKSAARMFRGEKDSYFLNLRIAEDHELALEHARIPGIFQTFYNKGHLDATYGVVPEVSDRYDKLLNNFLFNFKFILMRADFWDKMVLQERTEDEALDIWNGFILNHYIDIKADINEDCGNNLPFYFDELNEKLPKYIKNWDMYKDMFDEIEVREEKTKMYGELWDRIDSGEKPLKRKSFNIFPGDKQSLLSKILFGEKREL